MTYSVCLGSLMRCLPMIGTAQSAWLRIVFVASFLWSGPAFAPDDAIASPGPNSRTGDTRAARPGACSRQSTRCARSFRRRSCPVFSRHLRQARASNRRKPCHVPRRNRPRRQPQCRAPMRSSGCCAPRSRPSITPPDRQLRRLPRAGRARLSAGQRRCETSRQQARSAFNGAESGALSGGRKLA